MKKSKFVLEAFEKEQYTLTVDAFRRITEEMYGANSDVKKEIEDFVRRYGRDGVVTYKEARKWVSRDDHRRRMTVLLMAITTIYMSMFGKISKITEEHLNTIAENEYSLFGVKPNEGEIAKIMEKPWGIQDMSWRDHLDEYPKKWNSVHMAAVRLAFLRRDGIDKIIKEYEERAEKERRIIKSLLETESTAIGTLARGEILKEIGDVRYRIYTRVDERRCAHCASMHGMVFPFSAFKVGETAPPFHARCRCWIETVE